MFWFTTLSLQAEVDMPRQSKPTT